MWVGGPPNPIQPIRPHSRRIVASDTRARSGAAGLSGIGRDSAPGLPVAAGHAGLARQRHQPASR